MKFPLIKMEKMQVAQVWIQDKEFSFSENNLEVFVTRSVKY